MGEVVYTISSQALTIHYVSAAKDFDSFWFPFSFLTGI